MASFIGQHFVPVKAHLKEQPATFERFGVQWTPVLLVVDPSGKERYRWEGYLPPDDFLAHLAMGLAHSAFAAGDFAESERRFREVARRHATAEEAPEAVYYAGVSRYKASGDAAALAEAGRTLKEKYPQSAWAKKSSVWLG